MIHVLMTSLAYSNFVGILNDTTLSCGQGVNESQGAAVRVTSLVCSGNRPTGTSEVFNHLQLLPWMISTGWCRWTTSQIKISRSATQRYAQTTMIDARLHKVSVRSSRNSRHSSLTVSEQE